MASSQRLVSNKKSCTAALLVALTGCVSSSDVVQIDDNYYFVTAKDTGGVFSKDGKVVGEATRKAMEFCRQQSKKAELKDVKRNPEGPMKFETSDVYFSCK